MRAHSRATSAFLLFLALGACVPAATPDGSRATASPTPSGPPPVASGSLALFVTLSPGKTSSSIVVEGGERVQLDSTDYRVIRFTPDPPRAVLVDWTRSASYGKSYLYPFTDAGRLFIVYARGDGYDKTLQELDPRTNAPRESCSFTSYSSTKGFAIVGERVYYRARVSFDLLGRARGGGELFYQRLPCAGQPTLLLPANDPGNYGELVAAEGKLFAVAVRDDTIEVRLLDPSTGATEATANLTRASVHDARLFEGDDALYWARQRERELDIVRLPPAGRGEVLATLRLGSDRFEGLSIDASGDDVYVALADPDPRFFLIDARTREVRQPSYDPALFSRLIHGGGQILRTR